MDQIVNATGSDRITLWYLRNGRIVKKRFNNRSWIFATGDPYDLDMLSRQLDLSPFRHEHAEGKDVYGGVEGLRIYSPPSKRNDLIKDIERIGLSRKFRIYNGDTDHVMRFMSENGLRFHELQDPRDRDPELPGVYIGAKHRAGEMTGIVVNGDVHPVSSVVLRDLEDMIRQSVVVVYDNTRGGFSGILHRMGAIGAHIPHARTYSGSTYNSYGQTHYKSPAVKLSGKICIPSDSFIYTESGMAGIYEISRTSSLAPETAASVTPGTAVSTMEESIAIRSNIMIPLYKDDHEVEKTPEEIALTDRGGIALQPDPGLYEDVYEIDFSSMYPSIIVRYNLSPETIGRRGDYEVPDTPYRVDTGQTGFLPMALDSLLKKRLFYKSIRHEDDIYRRRDAALKWLLLTSFGYTGYKNAKFGKIEAHESITSIGRHVLSTAMKLAEDAGFTVIHGIVDSLWIKGDGDVESLLKRIEEKTRIGIVMDGHYRWICFFPARSGLGSLNRYLGMRYDGTWKIRGIEMRRNDVPGISRRFQTEALAMLEDCRNGSDIYARCDQLVDLEKHYISNIRSFPREDFRLNMKISGHHEDYRVRNIQKIALEKLKRRGIEVNPGERIPLIVADRKRETIDLDDEYEAIDAEFYRKHLYRAFEPFDFLVSQCIRNRRSPVMRLTDPAFAGS